MSERDDVADQQRALATDAADIEKRIARLVAAIETGGDSVSLVAKVNQLETRQAAIAREVASLHPLPRLAPAIIENRLAEWRRLLRASVTTGRTVLQRILRERITFTPRADGQGYDFEAPTRFDKLFTGIVVRPVRDGADLLRDRGRGTERLDIDDTPDGDYGRLLEKVAMRRTPHRLRAHHPFTPSNKRPSFASAGFSRPDGPQGIQAGWGPALTVNGRAKRVSPSKS